MLFTIKTLYNFSVYRYTELKRLQVLNLSKKLFKKVLTTIKFKNNN